MFAFGFLFIISLIILIVLAVMKKRVKVTGIITGVLFLITIISIVVAFMTAPQFTIDEENQTMTVEFMDQIMEFDLERDIQEQIDDMMRELEESQLQEGTEN